MFVSVVILTHSMFLFCLAKAEVFTLQLKCVAKLAAMFGVAGLDVCEHA